MLYRVIVMMGIMMLAAPITLFILPDRVPPWAAANMNITAVTCLIANEQGETCSVSLVYQAPDGHIVRVGEFVLTTRAREMLWVGATLLLYYEAEDPRAVHREPPRVLALGAYWCRVVLASLLLLAGGAVTALMVDARPPAWWEARCAWCATCTCRVRRNGRHEALEVRGAEALEVHENERTDQQPETIRTSATA